MNANAPTQTPETFDGHYATLEHWRGVAVLMILISHTNIIDQTASYPGQAFAQWIVQFSNYGTHLFVILSGYCITNHVCHLVQTGQQPLDFLRHRFLRIYPVYWIACTLTLALGLVQLDPLFTEWLRDLPTHAHTVLSNLFLITPHSENTLLLLPFSQPLIYGMGLYLLIALGFWFYRMGCPAHLLVDIGLGLAVIALFQIRFLPLYVLHFWPEFSMGALLFLALYYQSFSRLHEGLCLTGIAGLAAASWLLSNRHMAIVFSFTAAFTLALYYLHRWDDLISRSTLLRPLRGIGIISYSLYLVLEPLSFAMAILIKRHAEALMARPFVIQLILWTGCLLGGWLFYRLCEQPIEKWRRSKYPPQGIRDNLILG